MPDPVVNLLGRSVQVQGKASTKIDCFSLAKKKNPAQKVQYQEVRFWVFGKSSIKV
jgi:hypothetical protein